MDFAAAMAIKMHQAAMKGHAGWDDQELCTTQAGIAARGRSQRRSGRCRQLRDDAARMGAGTSMPDAFNVLFLENMSMRDALRAVLDEVSPGSTPISIDSSLPRSSIDMVRRAADQGIA